MHRDWGIRNFGAVHWTGRVERFRKESDRVQNKKNGNQTKFSRKKKLFERFRKESDRVQNEKNGNRTKFSRKQNCSGWTTEDIGCGY